MQNKNSQVALAMWATWEVKELRGRTGSFWPDGKRLASYFYTLREPVSKYKTIFSCMLLAQRLPSKKKCKAKTTN